MQVSCGDALSQGFNEVRIASVCNCSDAQSKVNFVGFSWEDPRNPNCSDAQYCRTRTCSDAQFAVSDAQLQVNFVGFSWEDQRNPIASVVLFPPEPPLPAALPAAGP